MNPYSLAQLSDQVLSRDLAAAVANDRLGTAAVLAHVAEFDARRLYLPAGYPSMHAYCVGELHLSEDAAGKRIHAARTARRFPAIFEAVAEGRLHLSGVIMLATHLSDQTVDELLCAATHKSRSQIEQLIADRFPRPDVPARLRALAAPPVASLELEHAPGRVGAASREHAPTSRPESAPDLQHAPGRVEAPVRRAKLAPLAPERFALQVTIGRHTRDKLRYAQELLSHRVPSGDFAEVLDQALDALIVRLEKQRFAVTTNPRPCKVSARPRHVPAHVRRAVFARDGGCCTFISSSGRRCGVRKFLELDHIDPVARGGEATVENLRLRCRAHNQYAAECTFGAGFMRRKRYERL